MMKKIHLCFLLILLLLKLYGCAPANVHEVDKVTVSILPIKYLVESITEDDFLVDVLVPPGSSPETYEPTPRQIVDLSNSRFLFTIGLIDFETELVTKVTSTAGRTVTRLCEGMDLLEGDCGHSHGHHHHGVDPHIWTSPSKLKEMAETIYNNIIDSYPDSAKYTVNYYKLLDELDRTDSVIFNTLIKSGVKDFIVYHPALTYYARDYGLYQISIEENGKEPSVDRMQILINEAKTKNIKTVLYQREFSRSVVETIAKDMGADVMDIDPLAENIPQNLIHITEIIANGQTHNY